MRQASQVSKSQANVSPEISEELRMLNAIATRDGVPAKSSASRSR